MVSFPSLTPNQLSESRHFQHGFRKAGSFELQHGRTFVNLLEVRLAQLNVQRAEILFESMQLGGSWNRHNPWLLRQQPGECNLCRRRAFAFCDGLDQLDQGHVDLASLRREPRNHIPKVGRIELRVLVDFAGEESSAEWAERHKADSKFLQRRQKLSFRPTVEQRVFALHGGNRLDRVRAPYRLNRRFRHAEVLDLACGDQLFDRSRHLLDRHLRINPVLVKEVDVIDAQTLQASVSHRFYMLWPAIGAACALARLKIDVEAELRGNHYLIADGMKCLADQLLVRKGPIGFGGIEMGDAKVVSGSKHLDHLSLVCGGTVSRRHAHAAEAES